MLNDRDQGSERRPTSFYMIVPCHDQCIRTQHSAPGRSHLSEYVRKLGIRLQISRRRRTMLSDTSALTL